MSKPSRLDTKELLSGYAGQFFRNILHPIDLDECDLKCLDTNSVIINFGKSDNSTNFLLAGTKMVLLLGPEAFNHYKGTEHDLLEERGYTFQHGGITYLPTFSPQDAYDRKNYDEAESSTDSDDESTVKGAAKTRRQNWRWWLYNDIQKLKLLFRNDGQPNRSIENFDVRIFPPTDQVIGILSRLENVEVFLDIETDKDLNLTCFGIGHGFTNHPGDYKVYVVPFKRYNSTLAYDVSICRRLIQALAVCLSKNTVVAHNSMFDLFVLAFKYKIPFPTKIFDTMLAWHRINPEVESSLCHLISYYTDEPFHKNDGVYDPENHDQEQQLWNYNAKDITTLISVYNRLQPDIIKHKCLESVAQINRSIRPYLTMMFQGCLIDVEKMLKHFEELENHGLQLERCLKLVTGRNLNPRSSHQVKKYLYEDLQLTKMPDKDATNEKQLLKLLINHDVPSIKIIIAARGDRKLASDLKFIFWKNNRFTTAYDLRSDTFRSRSRALLRFKKVFKGYGSNFQNKKISERILFIPDPGKIFVQCDQAGAEALIVAYLCRSGRYRQLFINGVKPHTYLALHVFEKVWAKILNDSKLIHTLVNTKIPELTKHPRWAEVAKLIQSSDSWETRYYFIAKQGEHSSNYDVKAPTFVVNTLLKSEGRVALTVKEGNNILRTKFELFPEIKEWHLDIQEEIKLTRRLNNLFNFPRQFTGLFGEDLWKKAYAFKSQSTVGVIEHIAITNMQEYIESTGVYWDIINNNHDSMLMQCPIEEESLCKVKCKEFTEQKLVSPTGVEFQMKSEVKSGPNWKDLK